MYSFVLYAFICLLQQDKSNTCWRSLTVDPSQDRTDAKMKKKKERK